MCLYTIKEEISRLVYFLKRIILIFIKSNKNISFIIYSDLNLAIEASKQLLTVPFSILTQLGNKRDGSKEGI